MGLRLTHSGITPETAYGGECGGSLPKRLEGGIIMPNYEVTATVDITYMIEADDEDDAIQAYWDGRIHASKDYGDWDTQEVEAHES